MSSKQNPRASGLRVLSWTSAFLVGLFVGCSDPVAERNSGASTDSTKAAPAKEAWFVDRTDASGLGAWRHISGTDPSTMLFMPEIVAGGGALFDADGDGDLDLYLVQSGRIGAAKADQPGNVWFRNDGNGNFELVPNTGAEDRTYGMGAAAADYDADGDIDLYVTNLGPNKLYRNDGNWKFTDVTEETRTGDPSWGTSATWFDFDRDGDLDIFIANYVRWTIDGEIECRGEDGSPDYCQPNNYQAPARDTLLRNDGRYFTDVSEELGISAGRGNGLGVVTADYNLDGRTDIFVSNDSDENIYWVQQEDGTFKDNALIAGNALNLAGEAEAGMGVANIDYDADGDEDLFLVHLRGQTNTFYQNDRVGFGDATNRLGLGASSNRFTGFGVAFNDFDLDGGMDLFVGNGKVLVPAGTTGDDKYAEENLLMSCEPGQKRFDEVLPRGGVSKPLLATSRGVILGDVDNDGTADLIVVNRDNKVHFLKNVIAKKRGHSWIGVDLRHTDGRLARGAIVRVEGSPALPMRVDPHWGFVSSHDHRLRFGLGDSKAEGVEIVIRWPDGREERRTLATRQYHRVVEGS